MADTLPRIPTDVTEQTLQRLERCDDPRLHEIVRALVKHLHAFVREVRLTPDEWMAGIDFLTRTGQKCDAIRQEFILLSDVLGVSMTVDDVAHEGMPSNVTESSALGPFYTDDAPEIADGETIARSGRGESVLVRGRVLDVHGAPIAGALVETWETDGDGSYDTQYANRTEPDYRGWLRTQPDGSFSFVGVKPVSYSIPVDGPVGELLRATKRGTMRPAHLHLKISAPGHRTLATSIYSAGDPYLLEDAVFGAKSSLVETYRPAPAGAPTRWVLERDFVLAGA
ncbi:MAG TPA: dioxygenase [Candidatus Elarobacter sp.]|jgi:catechol 1,2-dioxygenase|nr:dioxygenase [Candidatus Elarobacter sp.]